MVEENKTYSSEIKSSRKKEQLQKPPIEGYLVYIS